MENKEMMINEQKIAAQISDAELDGVSGGGKLDSFMNEISDAFSKAGQIIKALAGGDDEEEDPSVTITRHENGVNASW